MKKRLVQALLLSTMMVSLSVYSVAPLRGQSDTIETDVAVQEKTTNLSDGVTNVILNAINESVIEEYYEGWTTASVNVRNNPSLNSEILDIYPFNTTITYSKYNDEWAKIQYESEVAYINLNYISNKELDYKDYIAPITSGFKSYMSYAAITSKSSKQYKLQQQCCTGLYGIRVSIDERYCVAIGTAFNTDIGTYFDLILENGTVIPCIVGDIKADKHTDKSNMITIANGCLTEFIIDNDLLDKKAKESGDISYCNEKWNSRVEKIRVYDKNIFDERE